MTTFDLSLIPEQPWFLGRARAVFRQPQLPFCPLRVLVCNRMTAPPILAGLALHDVSSIAGVNRPFVSNWTASSTVHA